MNDYSHSPYVINVSFFAICLVFCIFMLLGHSMFEAGTTKHRKDDNLALKNILLITFSIFTTWVIGNSLIKMEYIGSYVPYNIIGSNENSENLMFLFRSFMATNCVLIATGAMQERSSLLGFILYSFSITLIIFPLTYALISEGGFLYEIGYRDFAGSSYVHITGGTVGLIGIFILGPRHNKYNYKGEALNLSSVRMPFMVLGLIMMLIGFYGFSSSSMVFFDNVHSINFVSIIFLNIIMAFSSGMIVTYLILSTKKNFENLHVLNGGLAGIVSILAFPYDGNTYSIIATAVIGAILALAVYKPMESLHLDDAIGAVPSHLIAGIWGTIAVGIFGEGILSVQIFGTVLIMSIAAIVSYIICFSLNKLKITKTFKYEKYKTENYEKT